jgi:hypothetical protein
MESYVGIAGAGRGWSATSCNPAIKLAAVAAANLTESC